MPASFLLLLLVVPVLAQPKCDIVIAGGSTASLAAAITAAEAAPKLLVCFTEITDWPGGQMTSGGVPAIDFGGSNKNPDNQPKSFRDFFNFVQGNPGACTVSIKCYPPNWLVEAWIMPRLRKSSNLQVFLRTTIIKTQQDDNGRVVSLTAVQRTPRSNYTEYSIPLSQMLPDWYSPEDSPYFTKQVLTLTGAVFVEGTEFADVLMTSRGVQVQQGVEIPTENDFATDSTCGQAWTLTFYMQLLQEPPAHPLPVPAGGDEGLPFGPLTPDEWIHTWTWRRALCGANTSAFAANVGDVTQQNLGNDLDSAYLFKDFAAARHEAETGWQGGINITAMKMLEGRAYGWYHVVVNGTPQAEWRPRINLNRTFSGTPHGLSKMPYLRDTRRSAMGLDDFKLTYPYFDYFNKTGDPRVGYYFNDSVALGNYNDDTHHLQTCTYPDYMTIHATKPYWIPFRAMTVKNVSNLLLAGKVMSQSFHANGATRLHPSEWTCGVAVGAAAVYMLENGLNTTREVYERITLFQAYLNSSIIGQPLNWTMGTLPPSQIGYVCALGRCVGVAARDPKHKLYPDDTCGGICQALGTGEWLANMEFWSVSGNVITATTDTVLKKSTALSSTLPPDMKVAVTTGTKATLLDDTRFDGYMLCKYPV
eukprot:m.161088 g.161088  ORF g.161088 m.161088 type:complete len:646 (-) comp20959_c0_seq3:25-1962(-)